MITTLFGRPIEDIIKDLEVLKILKKKMTINTGYIDIGKGFFVYEYIAYNGVRLNIETDEEFNQIKEWLEDE